MNKHHWQELARKTAWASGKKHLTKKELGELYNNILKLKAILPKKEFENFKERLKEPRRIGRILC